MGALDFAGGTVVHIAAGLAGLACCLVLGKRHGYPKHVDAPEQHGADAPRGRPAVVRLVRLQRRQRPRAAPAWPVSAFAATQAAAAAAGLGWMLVEWMHKGKPTALGLASGHRRRAGRGHAGERVRLRRGAALCIGLIAGGRLLRRGRAEERARVRRLARRLRRPRRRRVPRGGPDRRVLLRVGQPPSADGPFAYTGPPRTLRSNSRKEARTASRSPRRRRPRPRPREDVRRRRRN